MRSTSTVKGIADHPEGTRLKVRLTRLDEGNWSARQQTWIRKRLGQELYGTVEMCQGSLYFRPDRCNILVLRDMDVDILGEVKD